MSKNHETNSSNKAREAAIKAVGDFIHERYLPTAIRYLVDRWKCELETIVTDHFDSLDRILFWAITPDYSFDHFPDHLSFPFKRNFIQYLQERGKKIDGHLIVELINSFPDTQDEIKIAIFTPGTTDSEMRGFLSIGEINLSQKSISIFATFTNYNQLTTNQKT